METLVDYVNSLAGDGVPGMTIHVGAHADILRLTYHDREVYISKTALRNHTNLIVDAIRCKMARGEVVEYMRAGLVVMVVRSKK